MSKISVLGRSRSSINDLDLHKNVSTDNDYFESNHTQNSAAKMIIRKKGAVQLSPRNGSPQSNPSSIQLLNNKSLQVSENAKLKVLNKDAIRALAQKQWSRIKEQQKAPFKNSE